ncbi:MAG: hypothetical protein COV72_06650 [Candidatus Omnitrophica bacterium CG11_big_fil_rev_8_21_14_0_20_42_13]|uniref:His-Xaa-Ser system protein HxsD n=1 Tax=Candidatus Ghiorseimicrobium undicola TaxID=1974746 RepID=A0A2H0LWJ2_9BACT|nr:MAG: hypothetical protein COV72_06650 [Candidatus Omnitrophica bacterium CG11_big_fil_rev_8_21_14_0_20_42_13]
MLEKKLKITEDHAELRIDGEIYSKETIFAAAYIFMDKAYILLDKENKDFVVYIYSQQKSTDLRKLGMDFCNELINYAHYFSRVKENAEVIKTIMQRALFSAAPSLVKEAEEKEIEDLIRELEAEEKEEAQTNAAGAKKRKK